MSRQPSFLNTGLFGEPIPLGWLNQLSKQIAEYQQFAQNAARGLRNMERMHRLLTSSTGRLVRLSPQLAMSGWSVPNGLNVGEIIKLASGAKNDGSGYTDSILSLIESPRVMSRIEQAALDACVLDGLESLLTNCLSAMRRSEFALSCAGMFCIIEALFTTIHPSGKPKGYTHATLKSLLETVSEGYGYKSYMHMPASLSSKYVDVTLGIYCIEYLFISENRYNGYVARNRLLHGNDTALAGYADCIRLLICISNMSSIRVGLKALDNMKSDGLSAEQRTKAHANEFMSLLNRSKAKQALKKISSS